MTNKGPKIEVTPYKIPVDGTVTITIYGILMDYTVDPPVVDSEDPLLVSVTLTNMYVNTPGPFPDEWFDLRQNYHVPPGPLPVTIPKGGSWSIKFGTNAPDPDNHWWDNRAAVAGSKTSWKGAYMITNDGTYCVQYQDPQGVPYNICRWFDIEVFFVTPEFMLATPVISLLGFGLYLALKRKLLRKED